VRRASSSAEKFSARVVETEQLSNKLSTKLMRFVFMIIAPPAG
jgi:hypothetical protein